ncbi:MAG TPA: class I SAM-dependent methyltransferase [Planctomycetota bacterium]|nr:class I SAM-dependent methyltransferase [Planctomycetota bacterium]
MSSSQSFDQTWERDIYARGKQMNRWPFDAVVSFLFRHAPKNRPRSQVRVLEVGCGTGNNLWCAAREGFDTTGIDGSPTAIERARELLAAEDLKADLHVVDFTKLPFPDASFDLAIDRCALSCVGRSAAQRALGELARVLKPSGRLFFNPYSDRHTSARSGRVGPDDLMLDVAAGSLVGCGQLCFWNAKQVTAALVEDWRVLSRQHVEFEEQERPAREIHAEWRLVLEKVA